MTSIQIQIAMRIQNTSVGGLVNPLLIRIGSMRISCGCNQFELIRIQCALFLSCRQTLGVYILFL